MKRNHLVVVLILLLNVSFVFSQRNMERINRGMLAVKVSNGVYLGWRIFADEYDSVCFNILRNGIKINDMPVERVSNYLDTEGGLEDVYNIIPVVKGVELMPSKTTTVWEQNYFDIELQVPSGGKTPAGESYTYSSNDCSVGDLDGDGQYEIIVKWNPSNSKDNSQYGYTGNQILDAYQFDGTLMWRIDLGINIRSGAHYTQFMVYDLDNDGKAEIACKTAPGTKDGTGNYLSKGIAGGDNDAADYRNGSGYILSGPEYLTIFDGQTGKEKTTINYNPPRGTVSSWGDSYGNRVDRFLACVAYLDGVNPSLVMCRGYYTRTVLVAWDYKFGALTERWVFDTNKSFGTYAGQGNHNLSVADVDGDGKDEIVYGSMCVDDDGTGLYNTGLHHGDAMHVTDFDPSRPGLEVWACLESNAWGLSYRQAEDGKDITHFLSDGDWGRCGAGNITDAQPGVEMWGGWTCPLYNAKGESIGASPSEVNFMIWWDKDLLREFLDGTRISKYNIGKLLDGYNCASNNGSKQTPSLTADLFGDWREEVVWRSGKYLRIYTNTEVTPYGLYTFMHDPQYRLSVTWQNVAYNQPPHTSFYVGKDMEKPFQEIKYTTGECPMHLNDSWKLLNIGNVKYKGCADIDESGEMYVMASGSGMSGTEDECVFVHKYLVGDGEIIAHLKGFADENDSTTKIGLMFRESSHIGSKQVSLAYYEEYGLTTHSRKSTDGSISTLIKPSVSEPGYVKISRTGNDFTLSYSNDGISWSEWRTTTVEMESSLMVGIVAASQNNDLLTTSYVDNIQINGVVAGSILCQNWKNISGADISSLQSNPAYPDSPSKEYYLNALELPAINYSDDFGVRIRGYITPPDSGYYAFSLSSNQSAELWLSTDTSVDNSIKIAYITDSTSYHEWDKYPEQTSDSVYLEKGVKYYIEVIYKESEGDDHLSVSWSSSVLNNEVIDGRYLSPYKSLVVVNEEGIKDEISEIKVYPNPFNDVLKISGNQLYKKYSNIEIYDIMGRRLMTLPVNENGISVPFQDIQKGIYILKINGTENCIQQKIIKK